MVTWTKTVTWTMIEFLTWLIRWLDRWFGILVWPLGLKMVTVQYIVPFKRKLILNICFTGYVSRISFYSILSTFYWGLLLVFADMAPSTDFYLFQSVLNLYFWLFCLNHSYSALNQYKHIWKQVSITIKKLN